MAQLGTIEKSGGNKALRALALGLAGFGQGLTGQPFGTNLLNVFEKRRKEQEGIRSTDKNIDSIQKLPGQEGKFEEFRGSTPEEFSSAVSSLTKFEQTPSEKIQTIKGDIISRGLEDPESLSDFEKSLVSSDRDIKISSAAVKTLSDIQSFEKGLKGGKRSLVGKIVDFLTPGPTAFEKAREKVGGLTEEARKQFKSQFGLDKGTTEKKTKKKKGLPAGVTEEDIKFTMKEENLTRKQVLDKLGIEE